MRKTTIIIFLSLAALTPFILHAVRVVMIILKSEKSVGGVVKRTNTPHSRTPIANTAS